MKWILFCMITVFFISVSALAHFDGSYTQVTDIDGNRVTVGPISHAYVGKKAQHQHIFPENSAGAVSQTTTHKIDFGEETDSHGRNVSTRKVRGKSVKRVIVGYKTDVIKHYPKSRETGFFDSNGNPINYDGTQNTAGTNADCLRRSIAASHAYLYLDGPLPPKYDCNTPSGNDFWITQEDPADIHANLNRPAPVSVPQLTEYYEETIQVPIYEYIEVYDEVYDEVVVVYDKVYVEPSTYSDTIQIVSEAQVQAGEPGTVTLQASDPSILREPVRRIPFADKSIVITHVVLKEPTTKKRASEYRLYVYIQNASGSFRSDIGLYLLDENDKVKFQFIENRRNKAQMVLTPQNPASRFIRENQDFANGDTVANNRIVLVRPQSLANWDYSGAEGYNRAVLRFNAEYLPTDTFQLRWKDEVISEYPIADEIEDEAVAASPTLARGKLSTTWAAMKRR